MNRREAIKHAILGASTLLLPSTINSVWAEIAATSTDGPIYLSATQFAIATAFSDRLLPRSETLGALDVKVPQFIDISYGKYLQPNERERLIHALEKLDAISRQRHQQPFADTDEHQQDLCLAALNEPGNEADFPAWALLRDLVLTGYFTSAAVGKEVLNYDPIPGRWDPCIPVDEVGNVAWTEG